MSTQDKAGAYVPRPGDRVTVRRYIAPTTGERSLSSVHAGEVTNVCPQAGGFRIWLDGNPEWIFTGYQFLGAGTDGRGPASLVTEVTPAETGDASFYSQLTPDLSVAVDGSGCIVLVVINPATQETVRVVTVTNVDAVKDALDRAREEQHIALEAADARRLAGPDEKRRAEGRLTKSEAVEHLVSLTHRQRGHVVAVVGRARCYPRLGPERFMAAGDAATVFLVSFEADGYWRVAPASPPESGD